MYIPEVLLDNEGYPTDEYLYFIENYVPDKSLPILKFVEEVLQEGWWMAPRQFVLYKQSRWKYKLTLHTGGWSGNEDIISAILSNIYLTNFSMNYVMWKVGGHYYFEIKLR